MFKSILDARSCREYRTPLLASRETVLRVKSALFGRGKMSTMSEHECVVTSSSGTSMPPIVLRIDLAYPFFSFDSFAFPPFLVHLSPRN